jgi:hypothetical protein
MRFENGARPHRGLGTAARLDCWADGASKERSAMFWKVRTAVGGTLSGNHDATAFSRREMLAGIGAVGVCAVVGSAVLGSKPANATARTPVPQPLSDAIQTEAAEANTAEHGSKIDDLTEFSSQEWRRRRYRGRRGRYWRRRPWRRRWRVVCRRRWRRGRVVRVCRRVRY